MKRSSKRVKPFREPGYAENRQDILLKAPWSCRRNAIKVSKT